MIYGYVRISTPTQNIERQIRNIKTIYPDAVIVREIYTGRTFERPRWQRLMKNVKMEDKLVFDSVSRMARDAEEGFEEYQILYRGGIELEFLKEPHINTEVYRKAIQSKIPKTGTNVDVILKAVDEYLMLLAKDQIRIAFEQAQKEVDDLRQRTVEGLQTARINGKVLGRPAGVHYITKKESDSKRIMQKRAKTFGGDLSDADCMKIIGISRGSYYKYKKELLQSGK